MAEAADEEIGDRAGIPRPRETATLIGHGAAEAAFAEGIAAGRLHHAWLIGGPQGIGKATLAYRVARRLLAYPQGTGPAGLAIPDNHPIHGQVAGLSHPTSWPCAVTRLTGPRPCRRRSPSTWCARRWTSSPPPPPIPAGGSAWWTAPRT